MKKTTLLLLSLLSFNAAFSMDCDYNSEEELENELATIVEESSKKPINANKTLEDTINNLSEQFRRSVSVLQNSSRNERERAQTASISSERLREGQVAVFYKDSRDKRLDSGRETPSCSSKSKPKNESFAKKNPYLKKRSNSRIEKIRPGSRMTPIRSDSGYSESPIPVTLHTSIAENLISPKRNNTNDEMDQS